MDHEVIVLTVYGVFSSILPTAVAWKIQPITYYFLVYNIDYRQHVKMWSILYPSGFRLHFSMVNPELTDWLCLPCVYGRWVLWSSLCWMPWCWTEWTSSSCWSRTEWACIASSPSPDWRSSTTRYFTTAPPWLTVLNSDLSLTQCHMECINQS